MDEFQQIANLEDAHSLEASIRHAMERSKNIFYVFSGSNRTLLEAMFKKKNRPLYHLCDEIKINRIDKDCYFNFIDEATKKNWENTISSESINEILTLTECHPYYVNRLCRTLWDLETTPEKEEIIKIWNEYVESQKLDWISEMISRMSINQRSVMAALAKEKEPRGKDFAVKLAMSSSSIQRTINTLMKNDLIFKDAEGYYRILNPVIKSYLASNEYFDF